MMSDAPVFDINLDDFWYDPYPILSQLRSQAPIAYVPQLAGTVFARMDDITHCEKKIEVFSSHQPSGLMNKLMGHNLMRKDGDAHRRERIAMLSNISIQNVKNFWIQRFQYFTDSVLDGLIGDGMAELCSQFATPVSAEALKIITGLTNISATQMDNYSQAMIDGIANYAGDLEIERYCRQATACIDKAIEEILPDINYSEDLNLISAFYKAGLTMDSLKANIKLTISGGQNEPRDAISGTIWALLSHPDQLQMIMEGHASYLDAFEEYIRWIAPIGMSPRRINKLYNYKGIQFSENDRIFLLFGSANRDEAYFKNPNQFDITRDHKLEKHIAFGAGPHFCAGAAISRALVAEVALPSIFGRLAELNLSNPNSVKFGGWAFRGPLNISVKWDRRLSG